MIVQASDSAQNPKSATATVEVNIVRNLNTPLFVQGEYKAAVFDAAAVGTSLFAVTAIDADRTVPLNKDVSYFSDLQVYFCYLYILSILSSLICFCQF